MLNRQALNSRGRRSRLHMKVAPCIAIVLAIAPAIGGCLGGEARTEWAFTDTQLSALNDAGHTGANVIVAILDTGINTGHVAMRHLVDGNLDNGELVEFADYVGGHSGVSQAYDDVGHGTHVAGIVSASGSSLGDKLVYNGVDLLGAAPAVKLVVAKVCGKDTCDSAAIPQAIRWAVSKHAQVINLSLGGQRVGPDLSGVLKSDLQDAIQTAIQGGVVVVAAAGNDGTNSTDVSTPADIQGVIAVGATQQDGSVWDDSSRGSPQANTCRSVPVVGLQGRCDPDKKPELVAPGVQILSAWTGDEYVRASGTSQATPFVTSAVALLLQGRPALHSQADVEHVKDVLEKTAKHVQGQAVPHDDAAGYGFLQAKAAFEQYRPN
jgi:subtilisin family serine protease